MTNKEIAKQLGISAAALSLIINHKSGVSDKTRSEVINKLVDMGYGDLIKTNTSTNMQSIAFIVYKEHGQILDLHPFFLLVMNQVETYARKLGYSVILYTIDKRFPIDNQIMKLNELNAKGIILFATEMISDDISPFLFSKIPLVALDNNFSTFQINTVSIDNYMGTDQAINYLIKKGYQKIGYLKSTTRISSFKEREQGFKSALYKNNLSLDNKNVFDVAYTEDGSYRDIRKLLKSGIQFPPALVCDDDTIAVGALRAIREFGLRVPNDIAIIGFNNRPNSEITEPSLTTIDVPKNSLAISAVDTLIKSIEHPSDNYGKITQKLRIGTNLVIRESV